MTDQELLEQAQTLLKQTIERGLCNEENIEAALEEIAHALISEAEYIALQKAMDADVDYALTKM